MAMKEHMPHKADTTRLRNRTQKIRFLISISAAILKLMVVSQANSTQRSRLAPASPPSDRKGLSRVSA